MEDHMRTISLHSLIAEQQAKSGSAPLVSSPKRGVFAQKPKPVIQTKAPNSVFALGGI
jgi:hypothetical protein